MGPSAEKICTHLKKAWRLLLMVIPPKSTSSFSVIIGVCIRAASRHNLWDGGGYLVRRPSNPGHVSPSFSSVVKIYEFHPTVLKSPPRHQNYSHVHDSLVSQDPWVYFGLRRSSQRNCLNLFCQKSNFPERNFSFIFFAVKIASLRKGNCRFFNLPYDF